MDVRDFIHQPKLRSMAAGAIVTHCGLMHIQVTSHTIGGSLFKNQIFVAIPAIHRKVRTCQGEFGIVVVEDLSISPFFLPVLSGDLPTIRTVTEGAIHFEVFSMWRNDPGGRALPRRKLHASEHPGD